MWSPDKNSFSIVVTYAAIGCIYILLSDYVGEFLFPQLHGYGLFQTIKGLFFVITTAVLLLILIRNFAGRIEHSNKQYRYFFQNHPNPIIIYNTNTFEIVNANRASLLFLQASKNELIGKSFDEFLSHQQYDRFKKVVNIARNKSKYRSMGWKIYKLNGETAEVSIVSHSVTNDSDNVERLIMIEDLTEKMTSQRKLQKSEERLQQVLDGIDYTIWWDSSADDGFFYVSQAAENLYAQDIEILEKDPMYWYKYILDDDKYKMDEALDEFQKYTTYQKEIIYRIKDEIGNIKWVSNKVWKSMINGNPTFRGITIDITDQINYKKERESYIKQIENYAFSASHELRKPISNILGLTTLLFENIEDKEKATQYAQLLQESSDELDGLTKRLINDLEYTQRKQVD